MVAVTNVPLLQLDYDGPVLPGKCFLCGVVHCFYEGWHTGLDDACGIEPDKAGKMLEWMAVEAVVTRDELMQRFDLSERSQLRPLLAQLRAGRYIAQPEAYAPRRG